MGQHDWLGALQRHPFRARHVRGSVPDAPRPSSRASAVVLAMRAVPVLILQSSTVAALQAPSQRAIPQRRHFHLTVQVFTNLTECHIVSVANPSAWRHSAAQQKSLALPASLPQIDFFRSFFWQHALLFCAFACAAHSTLEVPSLRSASRCRPRP